MKVLFVCSGNSDKFEIVPFIKTQGDSLVRAGIEVCYFPIKAKGLIGYIKYAKKLKRYLAENKIDVIHAHYTLSGWTAVLSHPKKPIVLSLMGSDAYGNYIGENKITFKSRFSILLTYLIQPFIDHFICKSIFIQSFVFSKRKSSVLPNGVLLEDIPLAHNGFRKELKLADDKKYILFLGNKTNIRKNYKLVKDAISLLNNSEYELISPFPINHDDVIKYMSSVDLLVVPSFMEGSPNVIKEAMACNCPIVATNVGDVSWLFGEEEGYYITDFTPEDCACQIEKAIQFSKEKGRTKGRQQIINLGLNSEDVAEKIIRIYQNLLDGCRGNNN